MPIAGRQHADEPILGGERPALGFGVPVGAGRGERRLEAAAPEVLQHGEGHHALEHRHLDLLAFAGGELVIEGGGDAVSSEEHTSELQSLMRISYAVFFLTKTIM